MSPILTFSLFDVISFGLLFVSLTYIPFLCISSVLMYFAFYVYFEARTLFIYKQVTVILHK
jgi:hypothetical protein